MSKLKIIKTKIITSVALIVVVFGVLASEHTSIFQIIGFRI